MASGNTYNLRRRAGEVARGPSPDVEQGAPSPVPENMSSGRSSPTSPVRKYSDVVASRPPSPMAGPALPMVDPRVSRGVEINSRGYAVEPSVVTPAAINVPEHPPRNIPSSDGLNNIPRRRARSLDSEDARRVDFNPRNHVVAPEVAAAIQVAQNSLTAEQADLISNRNARVHIRSEVPRQPESVGEGPSNPKGKGVDPREWGAAGLNDADLDIDNQQAILNSIRQRKAEAEASTQRRHVDIPPAANLQAPIHTLPDSRYYARTSVTPAREIPVNMRADAQINPNSYLGATFDNLRRGRSDPPGPPGPPSSGGPGGGGNGPHRGPPPPGGPGRGGPDPYRGPPSSGGPGGNGPDPGPPSYDRPRSRSRGDDWTRHSNIKPFKPTPYNGEKDSRVFDRFARECASYLRMGRVPFEDRIFTISRFLKDKAYDYYVQCAAIQESEMEVEDFFRGLFNYIFPIDYIQDLRAKLDRARQKDKSVTEYVHELMELFNMIGSISERDRVNRFWATCNPVIRQGLWRDSLNPNFSSWEEVIHRAQIIEISENTHKPRDQKGTHHPEHNWSTAGGSRHSRSKNFPNNRDNTRSGTPSTGKFNEQHRTPPGSSNNSARGRGFTQSNGGERARAKFNSKRPTPARNESRNTPQPFKKEKAERTDPHSCFRCGESGHFARNCPQNSTVKHTGTKPPGFSTFSLEIEPCEEEVEVLESLPLGNIEFLESLEAKRQQPTQIPMPQISRVPDWDKGEDGYYPTQCLDDCYARVVEKVLLQCQPYPGDHKYMKNDGWFNPSRRFIVFAFKFQTMIAIKDQLTGFRIHIPVHRLMNPKFDVASWYAKRRAKALGLRKNGRFWSVLGYPLQEIPATVLQQGIIGYYPNVNPMSCSAGRFMVCPTEQEDTYVIHDLDLERETRIPVKHLRDPEFNIVTWYMEQLEEQHVYNSAYLAHRLERSSEEMEVNALRWDDTPSTFAAELEYLRDYAEGLRPGVMGEVYGARMSTILQSSQPYPGDTDTWVAPKPADGRRFKIDWPVDGLYVIYDKQRGLETNIHITRLRYAHFSVGEWFASECARQAGESFPAEVAAEWAKSRETEDLEMGTCLEDKAVVHLRNHGPYRGDSTEDLYFPDRFAF